MQIDQAELFLVRLPFASPQVVHDQTSDYCDTVFLRLQAEGLSGWAEVAPGNFPFLTAESSQSVFELTRDFLLPRLLKTKSVSESKTFADLFAPIKGNRNAKGVVDMAWWDLQARMKDEPLWKTLGGTKRPVEVGLVFDRNEDQDAFFREMQRVTDDCFRRITLKFRPGWDVQVVAAVRAVVAPLLNVQVDAEGALDPEMHTDTLYRLEDFFLSMIEQPFAPSDFVVNAMTAETLHTPITLDESITSLLEANIAIDLKCCRYFAMKPGRVGGHTEAKKIAEAAMANEIDCYGAFDLQSPLGYRHMLAMAVAGGYTLPCDIYRWNEVFAETPVAPLESSVHSESVPLNDGSDAAEERLFQAVELWDEPGVGGLPDMAFLEKHTLEHQLFSND
ncbi:MAG: enolase C-terminal domain-like protein [Thermoguttaceae bacterium]|nr:enolase C-terminal domain-like protein [Thermoguttaceae bacterium]